MKKLFTLFLFTLLSTLCAVAQDSSTFQFVDKGGNTVANGTSLTVSELTEDEIMGNFISTGLSVKNTSDSKASVRISYQIETLDNGLFQICFPSNCYTKTTTGSFVTTKGEMTAGEVRDLQCEWSPVAYGTCKVTLAIEVLGAEGTKVADGPAVQVTFVYADPTHVDAFTTEATVSECYTLQGRRVQRSTFNGQRSMFNGPRNATLSPRECSMVNGQRSMLIIRLSDGRIVKSFNK